MNHVLVFVIAGLFVYTIIPTFVIRVLGIGVYKKGTAGRGIALTFDDGPDPEYTPRLLELLKENNLKATFFVLGSKAEHYPELIKRMHNEGHLVGVHNYVHWANAFMTPKKVRLQLEHSVNVIEKIIGERPVYYRPPWGIINIFDFLLLKRFRMILWSIMVGDWRSNGGKRKIKERLQAKLRDGAVIVLHDSGQTFGADKDAPIYMLEALREFIAEALSKNYAFLRVDEKMRLEEKNKRAQFSLFKRTLIFLWFKWDRLFHWLFSVKPLDENKPLFFYRAATFRGMTVSLSDGEKLVSGDRVIELHFNNEALFHLATGARSPVHLAVQMIRSVKENLPKVTEKILSTPEYSDIKAIYGITMIHRGASQLGFTLMTLPNGLFSIITRMYLKILLYIMHADGKNRLKSNPDALIPLVLAISANEMKSKYPVSQLSVEMERTIVPAGYLVETHATQ
ncbi:polysaccharide deacetylase family protein [Paenibacillus planticolens]|uniref:Polysaccharide deacetylase family protein n=1 Tax=Paenibacillus planticolens TaxID=2654976 RepID=A0ABX1ZUX8_9BACL|nr:polysaccharide deacetylase family protein [Paenibacillus planticolens]NOV03696.1 polysaccharide deacetylase family protein [Paenibacillus planticolens]